ncbi:hypothetical protein FQR65_LT00002 [Abscondita terminalis]|nr:hypothetical protein FQR65_LT00002 [Abscondita terminalis]
MDWNKEKCLVLINFYKSYTILWNPVDRNDYDKNVREKAWSEIGLRMNTNPAHCKTVMKLLLARFKREQWENYKSVSTGKDRDEWFAFKAFDFLEDRYKPRGSSCTQSDDEDNDNSPPSCKKRKMDSVSPQTINETVELLSTSSTEPPGPANLDVELKSFFDFVLEKMKNYNNRTKNRIEYEIMHVLYKANEGYLG